MKLVKDSHERTVTKARTLSKVQNEAVEFLLSHYNVINGVQAGLGKTTIMLSALYHIFNYSDKVIAAIVTPKAATTAFIKDAEALEMPLSVCTSDIVINAENARCFVFNYTKLEPLEALLNQAEERGIKVIAVFDEVHTLGNEKSKLYNRMKALRKRFCCVYGMTATLFINNLEGLYNVIDFVRPNYLGTLNDFRKRYIVYKQHDINIHGRKRKIQEAIGYKNLDELKERVESITIIRGHKYNLKYHFISCKLTDDEWKEYKEASKGVFDDNYDEENPKDFGARLHDLQRIVDGSTLKNKFYTPSKVKSLLMLCKTIISRGESVLIYTDYDDTYKFLQKYIEKFKEYIGYHRLYSITGKTADKERRLPEKAMMPRDITIITKAGSASVNLQKANHIIYYNLPFSIGTIIQSLGRICRIDTKFDIQNLYVIEAEETIDTYKRLLFENHKFLMEAIYGDTHNLPCMTLQNPEDIQQMKTFFKNKFLWKRF